MGTLHVSDRTAHGVSQVMEIMVEHGAGLRRTRDRIRLSFEKVKSTTSTRDEYRAALEQIIAAALVELAECEGKDF